MTDRHDVVLALSLRLGVGRPEAAALLVAVQETLIDALLEVGTVKLRGFATIEAVPNPPRYSLHVRRVAPANRPYRLRIRPAEALLERLDLEHPSPGVTPLPAAAPSPPGRG